jgi:hypothetical protein
MSLNISIDELCQKLGVGYTLGAYQTQPWSAHDSAKGMTCSAEVRMGSADDELEAEAQMMYDIPPAGKPPMEQICYIKATPRAGQWDVVTLRIKGEPYGKDISNWQEKSCNFFSMLVSALGGNEIPDIDELIEEAFHAKERFYHQRQGGGGRAMKAKNAGALLGMKKGG